MIGILTTPDSAEYKFFETFEDVLKETEGFEDDGYTRIELPTDAGRCYFKPNATVELYSDPDGGQGVAVEFITSPDPQESVYFSGDSGTVMALADGCHVDTVWGDVEWCDKDLKLTNEDEISEFLEELKNIEGSFIQSGEESDEMQEAKALEAAFDCVNFDTYEEESGDVRIAFLDEAGELLKEKIVETYVSNPVF